MRFSLCSLCLCGVLFSGGIEQGFKAKDSNSLGEEQTNQVKGRTNYADQ
jgi:hypothetical protein